MEKEEKSAYVEKLEAQLREWSAKIDQLHARADKAKADARIEYQKQLDALGERREAARRKLDELKGAGDEAWGTLRSGVENAWSELRGAVEGALAKFK